MTSPLTLKSMLWKTLSSVLSNIFLYFSVTTDTMKNMFYSKENRTENTLTIHLLCMIYHNALCTTYLKQAHGLCKFNLVPFLMCAYLITKVMTDERWTHLIAFVVSRFIVTPKQRKAIGSQSNKRFWHWWACFPNTLGPKSAPLKSGWRGQGSASYCCVWQESPCPKEPRHLVVAPWFLSVLSVSEHATEVYVVVR